MKPFRACSLVLQKHERLMRLIPPCRTAVGLTKHPGHISRLRPQHRPREVSPLINPQLQITTPHGPVQEELAVVPATVGWSSTSKAEFTKPLPSVSHPAPDSSTKPALTPNLPALRPDQGDLRTPRTKSIPRALQPEHNRKYEFIDIRRLSRPGKLRKQL